MIGCIYLHHKSESFRLLSHTENVRKEIEMMVLDMKPRYLYAVCLVKVTGYVLVDYPTNYHTWCSVLNFELLSPDMKGNQFSQYHPAINVKKGFFFTGSLEHRSLRFMPSIGH